MSQYIKKLQAGGTFSTSMGDYDINEVLRAFNQSVQDDLNKLGHIRKKKWPEYENAYRDIVNGIQNGTLTIDAAGIVSGQIGDSEPYKFMVSSLNKAIQGLTAKETEKAEQKTEKVKYDASDNGMEAFNQYFFQGALPLGKKESNDTLNEWYLNQSDEQRNQRISEYLQFRAESLDPNLDYDQYGGYEKVKNGILAAKNVFDSPESTDNDRWQALNSVGLVKLANIGRKPEVISEEEKVYKAWLASNPNYMMLNDNDRRQAFELAKDKLRKQIFEGDTDTNNQNNGDKWMLDFVNTNWVPKSLYPDQIIYTHQFVNGSDSDYNKDKTIGNIDNNNYVIQMHDAYQKLVNITQQSNYNIKDISNLIRTLMQNTNNGRLITHYMHALINKGAIGDASIKDSKGNYILTDTINLNNGTVLSFNPNRNSFSFVYVNKEKTPELYTYMLDKLREYGASIGQISPKTQQSLKNGGIVKAQLGTNTDSFDYTKLLDNKQSSSNTQINDQRQYDHMHQPKSDSTFKYNSADIARMTGMGLDIAGILASFAPVYGTAISLGTGLGSTAANLYADIKDPNVGAWNTLGNAVSGVGLDLAGSIPGVGLSKLGRISKNLVRIAPMLSTIPAVKELIDSDTSMAQTWSKIGTDESFNMEDLKNIQSALQLALAVTSGTMSNMRLNGAKRALKKNNNGYNQNDKYSVKTKQTKNGVTTNVEYDLTENQYNTLKNTEKKEDRNKLLQEWFGSNDLNIEIDNNRFDRGFNHMRSGSYDFDRISGPDNKFTDVARYKRWQEREGLNGGSWFEPKLKERPHTEVPSTRSTAESSTTSSSNRTKTTQTERIIPATYNGKSIIAGQKVKLDNGIEMTITKTNPDGSFIGENLLGNGKKQVITVDSSGKMSATIISSNKFGGSLDYIRTLRNFTGDNAKSSIVLSKHENGGILKAASGMASPDGDDPEDPNNHEEITINQGVAPWYLNLWKQQYLTGWKPSLSTANWSTESDNHHKTGDLSSAYSTNKAYTDLSDLVGKDINYYYNNYYTKPNDNTLDAFITAYNQEIDALNMPWYNNTYKYNDRNWTQHGERFKKLYNSRSLPQTDDNKAYSLSWDDNTKDILGSTMWQRRGDIYEKRFDQLNPEEKKKRVHYVNGLGWVYKKENGHIARLDDNEVKQLGLSSNNTSSQPIEAPQSNQPTQPTASTSTTASTATSNQTQSTDTGAKVEETPEEKKKLEGMYAQISSLTRPQREYDWNKLLSNLHNAYPNAIALGRLAGHIYTAKGLERLALKNQPALKGFMDQHRYVYDDLPGEMAANAQANQIASQMGQPRTSDTSINAASMLEGLQKAGQLNYEAQLKSNDLMRQNIEKQLGWAKEVRDYNRQVKDFNLAALIEDANYKNKVKQATKSNIWTNVDTALQEQEYRAREKNAERKANQLYLDEKYLAQLAAQEAANSSEYQEIKAKLIDEYDKDKPNAALVAEYRKQLQAIQNRYSERLWRERYRLYGLEPPKTSYAKRGGRIDDSDIRKRQKDHDRLVKEVLHTITHHQKALDNLSKGQLLSIKKLLS